LYCKLLKDVIREAKRQHCNKHVSNSSNKTRITWDIVRSVTGKLTNVNTVQELEVNGKVIRNRQNIADFLNFFLSMVDDINNNPITMKPLSYLRQVADHSYPRIKYHMVTTLELAEIKSLKTKGSHGYDEISVKILKFSSPFIISLLTYISNKMLSMGIFPTASVV
jgi:hypothetical protein